MAASILTVRVTPRGARDEVEGYTEGVLRVRLRAPPVEGRANEALRRFLAERLDLPTSAVEIVGGERSRTKRVRIATAGDEDLVGKLLGRPSR